MQPATIITKLRWHSHGNACIMQAISLQFCTKPPLFIHRLSPTLSVFLTAFLFLPRPFLPLAFPVVILCARLWDVISCRRCMIPFVRSQCDPDPDRSILSYRSTTRTCAHSPVSRSRLVLAHGVATTTVEMSIVSTRSTAVLVAYTHLVRCFLTASSDHVTTAVREMDIPLAS